MCTRQLSPHSSHGVVLARDGKGRRMQERGGGSLLKEADGTREGGI
jgi:hypothetical protein